MKDEAEGGIGVVAMVTTEEAMALAAATAVTLYLLTILYSLMIRLPTTIPF